MEKELERSYSVYSGEVPKLSLKLLYLEVETHNENAQKLYLAHDFELHNRKLMKYKIVN